MKRRKLDKPILAEGEHTGHAHVIDGADVFETEGGLREFDLDAPKPVKHQEHKPVTLPKNKYTSGQVVEHDHFLDLERTVKD